MQTKLEARWKCDVCDATATTTNVFIPKRWQEVNFTYNNGYSTKEFLVCHDCVRGGKDHDTIIARTWRRLFTGWEVAPAPMSDPDCTMGVGDGSGELFVHGSYESIKAAQALISRKEELTQALHEIMVICKRDRDINWQPGDIWRVAERVLKNK